MHKHLDMHSMRECVLFIGTQFSNLYTSVDTPAQISQQRDTRKTLARGGWQKFVQLVHACASACMRTFRICRHLDVRDDGEMEVYVEEPAG